MYKIGKYFLLCLILVISTQIVFAKDFEVRLKTINNNVVEGTDDTASFNLTITNKVEKISFFRIYTLESIDWDLSVEDSTGNIAKVYPDSAKSFLVKVRSIKGRIGTYKISLNVRSQTKDEKAEMFIPINIVSAEGLYREYIPDIRIWVDMETKKIDPRKKTTITITLKNENPREIEELNIELKSRLIGKRKFISLGPLQEKAVEFTVSFDPLELPKKDILTVNVWTLVQDQRYPKKQPEPIEYEIISYADVKEDATVEEKFLKTEKTIIVSNRGNINKDYIVKIETTPFKQLFISTSPKASMVKEREKRYLVWNIKLNAEKADEIDTKTIVIIHNYRTLFFILILILIGIVGYFILRSPIVIKKSAVQTATSEEGILGIKVIIHIKNRGKITIEKIRVIDKIPNIAQLEKEFQIGTLKPSHILRGKSYISLKWDIPNLEALEERIITYQIRSRLSIIGGIDLHPAIVKYKNEKGKVVIIHSNRFTLQ